MNSRTAVALCVLASCLCACDATGDAAIGHELGAVYQPLALQFWQTPRSLGGGSHEYGMSSVKNESFEYLGSVLVGEKRLNVGFYAFDYTGSDPAMNAYHRAEKIFLFDDEMVLAGYISFSDAPVAVAFCEGQIIVIEPRDVRRIEVARLYLDETTGALRYRSDSP